MDDGAQRRGFRKARLLLAAAGTTVLLMDGCQAMSSGNLMAFPYDMPPQQDIAVPRDSASPPDLGTSSDLAVPTDGSTGG